MERGAYYLTAWRLGRYYRTYPAYVQDEVTAALDSPSQFHGGPRTTARGTMTDDSPAFVVEDGNCLSARWPGDAYLFASTIALPQLSRSWSLSSSAAIGMEVGGVLWRGGSRRAGARDSASTAGLVRCARRAAAAPGQEAG
jgi:hypothetical protein